MNWYHWLSVFILWSSVALMWVLSFSGAIGLTLASISVTIRLWETRHVRIPEKSIYE